MEGYLTGEVNTVLKADGAERPRVRFRYPSANFNASLAQLEDALVLEAKCSQFDSEAMYQTMEYCCRSSA